MLQRRIMTWHFRNIRKHPPLKPDEKYPPERISAIISTIVGEEGPE
jgi:hypothetical protein